MASQRDSSANQPSGMTLLELRRYAIRQRVSIRFTVPAAGECLVDGHGVAKIPSLRAAPGFDLETSLGSVEEFVLDPIAENSKRRKVSREQLQNLLGDAPKAAQDHED
jgi:hypothetical protein